MDERGVGPLRGNRGGGGQAGGSKAICTNATFHKPCQENNKKQQTYCAIPGSASTAALRHLAKWKTHLHPALVLHHPRTPTLPHHLGTYFGFGRRVAACNACTLLFFFLSRCFVVNFKTNRNDLPSFLWTFLPFFFFFFDCVVVARPFAAILALPLFGLSVCVVACQLICFGLGWLECCLSGLSVAVCIFRVCTVSVPLSVRHLSILSHQTLYVYIDKERTNERTDVRNQRKPMG